MITSRCARKILRRLATGLPFAHPERTIAYSAIKRQPSLHLQRPSRNRPTIGSAWGCSRRKHSTHTASTSEKGTVMADVKDGEEQSPQEEPPETVSSCTEALGGSSERNTKKESELVDKSPDESQQQCSGPESGSVSAKDNGAGSESDAIKQEGSDVDPLNTTSELTTDAGKNVEMYVGPSDTAAETISSEAAMTLKDGEPHRHLMQLKPENDKTPPPEEDEAKGHDQKLSAAAANIPPKHGGGGLLGSLKKFFSHSPGPRRDRKYYESLSLEEKREQYTCGRGFITLNEVETWEEFRKKQEPSGEKQEQSNYFPNPTLNEKVSLWRGDITKLEIDAIVNAANSSLLGGGGVDGAIHRAAGYSLKDECYALNGCETGDAKLTSGHRLPAKCVLHTVGPINGSEDKLRSCYERCLQLVLDNNIRSVAFCCIATGVYGYPNEAAAHVALETTRKWLESHSDKVDRIIFCVFLKIDYKIYSELLHSYFPSERPGDGEEQKGEGEEKGVAGKSDAMEVQGGGSATDSKEPSKEEQLPSTSDKDNFVIVEKEDSMPVPPTLQKSITEPAKRVQHVSPPPPESQPESSTQIEVNESPSTLVSKDEGGSTGEEGRITTAGTTDAGVSVEEDEKMDTESVTKRPKIDSGETTTSVAVENKSPDGDQESDGQTAAASDGAASIERGATEEGEEMEVDGNDTSSSPNRPQ